MTYNPPPIVEEGGKKETQVSDDNVQNLLNAILKELKILNLHMSLITDEDIKKEDVE